MERLANHFPLRITIVAVRQPKVADFAAILVVQQHILLQGMRPQHSV